MRFTKMHGAGNDYVYVNLFCETVNDPPAIARYVSDRHFGIGSDGLILIAPSDAADCRMIMFNADGSEAAMCGNGIRCVGKYAYDHGIVSSENITVETGDGIKTLNLQTENGKVISATVDMGVPRLTSELPEKIVINGEEKTFTGIDVGSKHAVYLVDDTDSLDLASFGPACENHPRFPDRVNSEFIQVIDRGHIKMRVWERGSGETLACGTGSTASVVAGNMLGLLDDTVKVDLLGGTLTIFWDHDSGHVFMTGPAMEVFNGEIELPVDLETMY